MAKASKDTVSVPVIFYKREKIVTIELNEREAYAVQAVLGAVSGTSELRKICTNIYLQMESEGFYYSSVENPFRTDGAAYQSNS